MNEKTKARRLVVEATNALDEVDTKLTELGVYVEGHRDEPAMQSAETQLDLVAVRALLRRVTEHVNHLYRRYSG